MVISKPVKQIIRINRNDSYIRNINIRDSDGDLIDCTGWTIYFTVRSVVPATSITSDVDAAVKIHKSITGEASGIHVLNVLASETNFDGGEYFFDIQVDKSDGSRISYKAGNFIVDDDITRTGAA